MLGNGQGCDLFVPSSCTVPNNAQGRAVYPTQVPGLSPVTMLGARAYHSLAVTANGSVFGFGSNNHGELGCGNTNNQPLPVLVVGVSNPLQVTTGYFFSVALLQDHTLVAWGQNDVGQLGIGTTTDSLVPVPVVGLTNVTQVSAGWDHVLAVKDDGTVWTWGSFDWTGAYQGKVNTGKLCTGALANQLSPVQVPGITNAKQVHGGR